MSGLYLPHAAVCRENLKHSMDLSKPHDFPGLGKYNGGLLQKPLDRAGRTEFRKMGRMQGRFWKSAEGLLEEPAAF